MSGHGAGGWGAGLSACHGGGCTQAAAEPPRQATSLGMAHVLACVCVHACPLNPENLHVDGKTHSDFKKLKK